MGIHQDAVRLGDQTTALRRQLHRYPELSGREERTVALVCAELESLGIAYTEVEQGGVLGVVGREPGPTVLLRADLDALPIREHAENLRGRRPVVSEIDGVMHACGHDAHTAMLLTAARLLKAREESLCGRVLLMFERGEEGGGNLKYLLEYIDREGIPIDAAHAVHVRPGLPSGQIAVCEGAAMAGAFAFEIALEGRGGHGSRPDLANNPLDCFAALYSQFKELRLRQVSPFDNLTFSVNLLHCGNKSNIIPDKLVFAGSARFVRPETGERFAAEFDRLLEATAGAYGVKYEFQKRFLGIPLRNDPAAVRLSREGIRGRLGYHTLAETTPPLMGSESFSWIAARWPSVMIHLGIDNEELGCGSDLHTDRFDLDEEALPLGVTATVGFALDYLALNRSRKASDHAQGRAS